MIKKCIEIVGLRNKNEIAYKKAFSILSIGVTVLFQKKIFQSEQKEQGNSAYVDFEEGASSTGQTREERAEGIHSGKVLGRDKRPAMMQNAPSLVLAGCPNAVAKAMFAHLGIFSPIKAPYPSSPSQEVLASSALSKENLPWAPNKAIALNQSLASYLLKESIAPFFLAPNVQKTSPISMLTVAFGKELSKTLFTPLSISQNATPYALALQTRESIGLNRRESSFIELSQVRISNEILIDPAKQDFHEETSALGASKENIVYSSANRVEGSKQIFLEEACAVRKELGSDPSIMQRRNQEVEKSETLIDHRRALLAQGGNLLPTEMISLKDSQYPKQTDYVEISSASLQKGISAVASPQLPSLAKWEGKGEMEKRPYMQKERTEKLEVKQRELGGMQVDLECKMCFQSQSVPSGSFMNRMDMRKNIHLTEDARRAISQNGLQEMSSETKNASFQTIGEHFLTIASKLASRVKGVFPQEKQQVRMTALLQREEIEGQGAFLPEFIVKVHAPVEIIENYSGKQSDSGRIYDTFRIIENYSGDGRVAL